MGANSYEYTKQKEREFLSKHNESGIGSFTDKKFGSYTALGLMAPMVGNMAKGAMAGGDFSNVGDAIGTGAGLLGAAAAPLMYRMGQKQALKDNAADTARRKTAQNESISISQGVDSFTNAGKSVGNTAGLGLGALYGYGALTGGGVDPAFLISAAKARSAMTVGGAVNLANGMANGVNPLAGLTNAAGWTDNVHTNFGGYATGVGHALGGTAHMAGNLLDTVGLSTAGKGLGKAGDYISGIGDHLGGADAGMTGTMAGIIAMMGTSMLGGKLTRSIKNMARSNDAKQREKFRYSTSGLTGSTNNREISHYDTMTGITSQINMLNMTGKLSPYENLSLQLFRSIDKKSSALPAMFETMDEAFGTKGSTESKYLHNDLSEQFQTNTEFSSTANRTNKTKSSMLGDMEDDWEDATQWLSKKVMDVSTYANSLGQVLPGIFGSLLGANSTDNILAMYGLDDAGKTDKAIERVSQTLNIPTGLTRLAETSTDQILHMSETFEGKNLAILSFIAELSKAKLQLLLDKKSHDEGTGGFFNKVQDDKELHKESLGRKFYLKSLSVLGKGPLIGALTSLLAAGDGIINSNRVKTMDELREDDNHKNTSENRVANQHIAYRFLAHAYPKLMLEGNTLDKERNSLLKQILECNGCTAKKAIKQTEFWEHQTGTVGTLKQVRKLARSKYEERFNEITGYYNSKMDEDPANKNKYRDIRRESIKNLYKEHKSNFKTSTNNKANLGSVQDQLDATENHDKIDKLIDFLKNSDHWAARGSRLGGKAVGVAGAVAAGAGGLALGGISMLEKSLFGTTIFSKFAGTMSTFFFNMAKMAWKYPKVSAVIGLIGISYYLSENPKMFGNMVSKIGKSLSDAGSVSTLSTTAILSYGIFSIIKGAIVNGHGGKLGRKARIAWRRGPGGTKVKMVLGLLALGYLGTTFLKSKMSGIIKSLNSLNPFPTATEDDKKAKATSVMETMGNVIQVIGSAMLLVPNPVTKVIGGVLYLAGLGVSSGAGSLTHLMKSAVSKHPWLADVLPDNFKKSLGIGQKSIKQSHIRQDVNEYIEDQKKNILKNDYNGPMDGFGSLLNKKKYGSIRTTTNDIMSRIDSGKYGKKDGNLSAIELKSFLKAHPTEMAKLVAVLKETERSNINSDASKQEIMAHNKKIEALIYKIAEANNQHTMLPWQRENDIITDLIENNTRAMLKLEKNGKITISSIKEVE